MTYRSSDNYDFDDRNDHYYDDDYEYDYGGSIHCDILFYDTLDDTIQFDGLAGDSIACRF